MEMHPLGAHVTKGGIAGAEQGEGGRLPVHDADPEPRGVERSREVVHEEPVALAGFGPFGRVRHELGQPLELNARGELATEVSFEVLEEIVDEEFERRRVRPVGRTRDLGRQGRKAAKRADFFGASPKPLDRGPLRVSCRLSQGGIAERALVP